MRFQKITRKQLQTISTIAGILSALGTGVALAVAAYAADSVEPITARPLSSTRAMFTDDVGMEIRLQQKGRDQDVITLDDPSRVMVVEFIIQPGAVFPWHTHPGPVLAGLDQGELIYIYADDCVERPYSAGTMFIDPGGDNVHTAYNPSATEEAVVVATILDAPAEGPVMLPVDGEGQSRLDEQCGIDR